MSKGHNSSLRVSAATKIGHFTSLAVASILVAATIYLVPVLTQEGNSALASSGDAKTPTAVYLGFGYTINGFGGSLASDNLPAPFPQSTSTPVTFDGYSVYANSSDSLSTSTYDSGAVLIENTSGSSETISNLTVTIGSTTYSSMWANQTLAASQAMAAYQTASTTDFNTTSGDTSCTTAITTVPQISFTVTEGSYSGTESYSDTGLVLTDNGFELYGGGSSCLNQGNNSDAEAWTPVGSSAALPPSGGPPAPQEEAGTCQGVESECSSSNIGDMVTSQGVNTDDGDLSMGYHGFSAPALGHPLNFDPTYDSSIGQLQAASSLTGGYAGPFGPGWSDGLNPSITLANASPYTSGTTSALGTTATLNTGNGAEALYAASSASGACVVPSGLSYEQYWGDIPNSNPNDPVQTMCSEPRVSASLSYESATNTYLAGFERGQQNETFDQYGTLEYFGAPADSSFVSVSFSVSPGTGDCPAATGFYFWITQCTVYTDAAGRQMALAFNSNGEVRLALDPAGAGWFVGYSANNKLQSITDPMNDSVDYKYDYTNSNPDLVNDLLTATTPLGSGSSTCGTTSSPTYTTCYAYNSSGQITSVSDGLGNETNYNYHQGYPSVAAGEGTIVTDPNGNKTEYNYMYGELLRIVNGYTGAAKTQTVSFNLNPLSLESTQSQSSTGQVSTTAYDVHGQACWTAPATVGNGISTTEPSSCDGASSPPADASVTTYDSEGQPVAQSDPTGQTETTSYNSAGEPTGTTPSAEDGMTALSGAACPSATECFTVEQTPAAPGEGVTQWSYSSSVWTPTQLTGLPQVGSLQAISCPSTSYCYAVGTASTPDTAGILATTNGGATWTSTTPSGVSSLDGISCPSTTTCVATGVASGSHEPADLSTTDGVTWTSQDLSSVASLSSVDNISCGSSSSCIAVGADTSGNADIITGAYSSSWSWTSELSAIPSDSSQESMTGVSCSSNYDCTAVGTLTSGAADILATTSGGSSWAAQSAPSYTGTLTSVSCPSSSDCYAAGASTALGETATVIDTTNAGSIWSSQTVPGSPSNAASESTPTAISCASTSVCLIAAGTSAGGAEVLITTSSGSTWVAELTITGVSTSTYYTSGCDPIAGTSDCAGTDIIDELASETDANGNTTTFAEDAEGNTFSSTDPYGNETTMSYDDMGNELENTSPRGNVSGATWQEYTTFTSFDDGNQACWTATNNSSTPSSSCSSPPSNATVYTYDANGDTTNVKDPVGNHTSTAYDADGNTCWTAPSHVSNPACSSPPSGATLYTYDTDGNRLSTTDADGNENSWQFDNPTCPTSATSQTLAEYPSGDDETYTYDNSCNLTSETDPEGVVTTFGFDAMGQKVGEYPGDPGGVASVASLSCYSTIACVAGGTTVASAAMTLETTNSGSAFAVGSSLSGDSVTGVSCPSTTTCYAVGTDSSGAAAIWGTTNSGSSWSAETVPSGTGALDAISCSSTTPIKCTAVGWGVNQFDPIDVYTRSSGSTWNEQDLHSSVSQLGSLEDVDCVSGSSCIAVGSTTSGNADIATASFSGGVWSWVSDLSSISGDSGQMGLSGVSCSSTSDCTVVGENENDTGDILWTTNFGSSTWTLDTAPTDVISLSSVSCPSSSDCSATGGSATEGLAAIIATTNSGTTWNSQTPAVNTDPISTSPDPATTDELDSISCPSTSVCYAAGASDAGSGVLMENSGSGWSVPAGIAPEAFAHDSDGQQTQMVDSSGTTTYGYTSQGQVSYVEDAITGGSTTTVSYGYDPAGNVTCMAYLGSTSTPCSSLSVSSNEVVTYGYDSNERMATVEDWNGNITTFGYDGDSNLSSISYPSAAGTSMSMAYDGADSLTGQTTTSTTYGTSSESWSRRDDELISNYTPPGGSAEGFSYDGQDRLTQGNGSTTGATYSYSSGQELTCDTEQNSSAYNCPSSLNSSASSGLFYGGGTTQGDELCASVPGTTTYSTSDCGSSGQPSGETEYNYTADAQRKKSTLIGAPSQVTTYGWNNSGNLDCITVPNTAAATCTSPNASYTTTFGYDASGLMVEESPAGGTLQSLTWDTTMSDEPRIVSDGLSAYIYGPNEFGWGNIPIEQVVNGGTVKYLETDPSGIRSTITLSGSITESQTYSPYGRDTLSGSMITSLGFQGGYQGGTNGLVYFLNRFYDPTTGQFLSVDDNVVTSDEPYEFAQSDPTDNVDPTGQMSAGPYTNFILRSLGYSAAQIKDAPQLTRAGPDNSLEVYTAVIWLRNWEFPGGHNPNGETEVDNFVQDGTLMVAESHSTNVSNFTTKGGPFWNWVQYNIAPYDGYYGLFDPTFPVQGLDFIEDTAHFYGEGRWVRALDLAEAAEEIGEAGQPFLEATLAFLLG